MRLEIFCAEDYGYHFRARIGGPRATSIDLIPRATTLERNFPSGHGLYGRSLDSTTLDDSWNQAVNLAADNDYARLLLEAEKMYKYYDGAVCGGVGTSTTARM